MKRAISRKIAPVSEYVVKLSFGDEYSRGWNSGRINPTPPDNKQQDPSGRLPRQSVRLCWIRGTWYVRYIAGVYTYIRHGRWIWTRTRGGLVARPRRISLDERAPVRLPGFGHRYTRRKVTIRSGCRKLAGFAGNGPCWYRSRTNVCRGYQSKVLRYVQRRDRRTQARRLHVFIRRACRSASTNFNAIVYSESPTSGESAVTWF